MDRTELSAYERRARVARLINKSQSKLVVALGKDLDAFGVSVAQYVILSTLWAGRCDTAAQLCKEICYSPGAMTRMLDRLEEKGLIDRLPHPSSRRAHLLALTTEGQKLFPELLAKSGATIDRLLGDFNSNELNRFEALLDRVLASA